MVGTWLLGINKVGHHVRVDKAVEGAVILAFRLLMDRVYWEARAKTSQKRNIGYVGPSSR